MKTISLHHDSDLYRIWFKKLTALIVLFLTLALMVSCSKDASSDQPVKQPPQVAANPSPEKMPPQPVVQSQQPKQEIEAKPQPAADGPASIVAIDVDGNRRPLSDFIGKQPTVINFWGTWCPPCRREIPELVKLYKEYHPKGVEIVSLALERTYGPAEVKAFAQEANMKWVMAIGAREMALAFRLSGSVPETIFYDKNGTEVTRFVGGRDYNTFKKAFESIIAQ